MGKNNKGETYIFVKMVSQYYWKEKRRFFSPANAGYNLLMSQKELNEARASGEILDYDNICYRKGGVEGCFNLLNEDDILKPSDNPILDEDIKLLIENVAGHKEINIDYLHRAILYKYANVNDFTIPAIVFAGRGGSGKGTFISLLGTIFGEENVMSNLGQRDLTGSFDSYKGLKLVVEFSEVTTNNTQADKRILNKLKNMAGAQKITVNEKGVQVYQIDNIAWFFISSNSNKPLQLDDKDKGNRRFTVLISNSKLENGEKINKSIRDKVKVSNYLSWLYENYPEVLEYSKLEALDNEDKRELEERSQEESNSFWEWVEERYPDFKGKKRIEEVNDLISKYCFENDIDEREFKKYMWNSSKYARKKIRFGEKTYSGVELL